MAASMHSEMEEHQWIGAALQVLMQAHRPMHYSDIKRNVFELSLVPLGLKSTLEAALCKESQKLLNRRLYLVDGQPGVFALVNPEKSLVLKSKPKPKPSAPSSAVASAASNTGLARPVSHRGRPSDAAKYREKYRRLKRIAKEMIFTNAAYCDEVTRIEEKVARCKEERRYLMRKLMQFQASDPNYVPAPTTTTTVGPVAPHTTVLFAPPSAQPIHTVTVHPAVSATVSAAAAAAAAAISAPMAAGSSVAAAAARPSSQSIAQLLGEVDKRRKKTGSRKKQLADHDGLINDECLPSTAVASRSGKKASRGVGLQRRRVTPVPLDNCGRPIFPIELGLLTVYSLGEIIPLAGYYTTDLIYPVGFCSTRLYLSIRGSSHTCLYTCKVSDTGSAAKFEISPEDAAEKTFTGSSPNECHLMLLNAINCSRGEGTVPMPSETSGAEFFGLSHSTIQNLIQSCAGARKCTNYHWARFEVMRSDAEMHAEDDATVNVQQLEPASAAQRLPSVMPRLPTSTVPHAELPRSVVMSSSTAASATLLSPNLLTLTRTVMCDDFSVL